MTCNCQANISKAQFDQLALAGQPSMPLGAKNCCGSEEARHRIPCWEHVIDRSRVTLRAGNQWKAQRGVHGVVHRGATVTTARDDHHDQIRTESRQLLI